MNNHKQLVSVVVPTFNQERFIAETLQSIVNQTYKNLEILVSDDGSTDRTVEIINTFAQKDSRIKPFFSTKNRGIPYNFNRAFDACAGEFVAFFSGDDLMYANKIEQQVHFLNQNSSVDLVMHEVEIFDSQSGSLISVHKNTPDSKIPDSPLQWLFPTKWVFNKKYSSILPTSILARSSYYLKARYDERFKYKHELLFHLENYLHSPKSKWAVLPEILGKYRQHIDNFTNNKELSKLREEEKFLIHALVLQKYPQVSAYSRNFIHFTMFENLLFYEFQKKNKYYLKQFYLEAGFWKFSYLYFCLFLKKMNLLFPFFKIFRFLLRIK